MHRLTKVVSGGQTGVDRAALDSARALGIATGGWCPLGRKAEDGTIPGHYPLRETPTDQYSERTRYNVRDSDATLALIAKSPLGGTALAIETAQHLGRPLLVLDLLEHLSPEAAALWLSVHEVGVLNVAGPRESEFPGAYERAWAFLDALLRHLLLSAP